MSDAFPRRATSPRADRAPTRRAMLAGGAAALALPALWLRSASADGEALSDLLPSWMDLRLAVPNAPDLPNAYADYGAIARHGGRFVSENLTKTVFTVPSGQQGTPADAVAADFAPFEAQRTALVAAGAADPVFDLHGTFWHNSLSPAIAARLAAAPDTWQSLLDRLFETHVAPGAFPRFDINEVQRADRNEDARRDFWRGSADEVRNGSLWYQAARDAPWPHGPGYWWLHAAQRAAGGAAAVIYQDFDLEAGRPWGTGAGSRVPDGFEARVQEVRKRRRVLDAVNYALVHGGRLDVLGLQAHLVPWRAVDETDLGLWLDSVGAMGLVPEITELDVRPARDGTPSAEAYAASLLAYVLDRTRLFRLGAWTGWAPPGEPPRHTLLDRDGISPLGRALVRVAAAAASPRDRSVPAPCRFYQLCFGVTGDIWRAARNTAVPGFETEGNARGSRVLPGSGGAALPLSNSGAAPGRAVAPVWRDGPGATMRDTDPTLFSLALQWHQPEAGAAGPLIALGPAEGPPDLVVEIAPDGTLAAATGDVRQILGRVAPGPQALALTQGHGEAAAALGGGAPPVPLAWRGAAGRLIVLGDGARETPHRATCLTLWRDPAPDADTLIRRATAIGSVIWPREAFRLE